MNPEVIITNLKQRYSGVSGTINALLPVQARTLKIGFVGTDLPGARLAEQQCPGHFRQLTLWQAICVSRKRLPDGRPRIWHVRRDPEMMLAIFLRDVLRFPIKLVFTSAAKHRHSWFPRWLISKMDGVIATTPEAASHVPNTTQVVPHGIALERFSPPPDKLAAWRRSGLPGKYGIGTFGRIRDDKGSDVFVDAMIEVLPDFPEWTAVLAGLCTPQHQAFEDALKAKIAAAGLANRILFLGVLGPDEVAYCYQNVLLTVACPRYEPFGLTPLEGMACGSAVIATDTGAFRTLVDEGTTGHVIPTGSVPALVDALRSLLSDPARVAAMGARGRERAVALFSVEREAAGIQSVYDAVLPASTITQPV